MYKKAAIKKKWLPQFFSHFQDIFLNDFLKNLQTRNARTFLPLNIPAVGSVNNSSLYRQLLKSTSRVYGWQSKAVLLPKKGQKVKQLYN